MIDVIIGIISVSFLFFMVRIFMKFNSATYKNNFTKNDNFIVENVKVIKIVIAVCTCIIGAIWLLFVLICSKKGAETGNLIPTLIFATVYKGNIIKNLIMDCQSYTKYRPNETTGGIFVSWRRKEELPTGA